MAARLRDHRARGEDARPFDHPALDDSREVRVRGDLRRQSRRRPAEIPRDAAVGLEGQLGPLLVGHQAVERSVDAVGNIRLEVAVGPSPHVRPHHLGDLHGVLVARLEDGQAHGLL